MNSDILALIGLVVTILVIVGSKYIYLAWMERKQKQQEEEEREAALSRESREDFWRSYSKFTVLSQQLWEHRAEVAAEKQIDPNVCAHCGNPRKEDSRGNCASCGAPLPPQIKPSALDSLSGKPHTASEVHFYGSTSDSEGWIEDLTNWRLH